tara:strand:- start:2592 stop:3122 length:531 start_codon:yes stop_codon:yes gene_type:complete
MTKQKPTTPQTGLTAEQQKRRATTDVSTSSPMMQLMAMTQQKQARMLRLTLELVRQKREQGLALTVAESELLAECQRRFYGKHTERRYVDANGSVHVEKTMDASPIMQAMKDYGDILGTKRNENMAGARMVGGLDPYTAANWAKETGLKIGTKEYAQFAMKRIKEDSLYRKFRVGH